MSNFLPPRPARRPAARIFAVLCDLSVAAGVLSALLIYAPGPVYPFNLVTNFAGQGAILALAAAVVFLMLGMRIRASAMGIVALAAGLAVVPYLMGLPREGVPVGAGDGLVRIMSANIHADARTLSRLAAQAKAQDIDILILQETHRIEPDLLRRTLAAYPHVTESTVGIQGAAVAFSKIPFEARFAPGGKVRRVLQLDLRASSGRRFTVLAAHATSPVNGARLSERDGELYAMADLGRRVDGPLIIAGDFNVTPWTPSMRAVERASGTRRVPSAWLPTWHHPVLPIGLPIDHLYVSGDITVADWTVGPDIGSDHLPVSAVLILPE